MYIRVDRFLLEILCQRFLEITRNSNNFDMKSRFLTLIEFSGNSVATLTWLSHISSVYTVTTEDIFYKYNIENIFSTYFSEIRNRKASSLWFIMKRAY